MPPVTGVITKNRKGGAGRLLLQAGIIDLLEQGLTPNDIAKAFQLDMADLWLKMQETGERKSCR